MGEKYMCMVVWDRKRRDLEGRAVRSEGVVSRDPLLWAIGGGGYAVEVLRLPDVPVQCRPVRVGEDSLGQGHEGVCWVIFRGLQLADVRGCWQCGARGAVRCGVVIST